MNLSSQIFQKKAKTKTSGYYKRQRDMPKRHAKETQRQEAKTICKEKRQRKEAKK
jgi:hypothetical protein